MKVLLTQTLIALRFIPQVGKSYDSTTHHSIRYSALLHPVCRSSREPVGNLLQGNEAVRIKYVSDKESSDKGDRLSYLKKRLKEIEKQLNKKP